MPTSHERSDCREDLAAKIDWPLWGPKKLIDKLGSMIRDGVAGSEYGGPHLESHGLVRKRWKRRGVGNIRHAIHTLGANESGEMMTWT